MMKKETWKPVTIGGVTGILMGAAATYGVQAAMNSEASASESDNTPVDYDSLSFKDAFDAARAQMGPGGVFTWHGNLYNTYTAAEWNAKTHQEKEQFAEQVAPQVVEEEEDDDVQVASLPHEESNVDNSLASENMQTVSNEASDDDDVRVVGFGDVVLPNGQTITVEELDYNGQRVAVIDFDQDGTPDIAMSDLNGNHRPDEGEVIDLQTGEALTFPDNTSDTVEPTEDFSSIDM